MHPQKRPIIIILLTFNLFRFLVPTLTSLTIFSQASASIPPAEKPKVIVQTIQLTDDNHKLLFPAKVEPQVSSSVAADLDGNISQIKKNLGTSVKAGEIVLYIENRDPAFTYSAVPVRAPMAGVISQLNSNLMTKVSKGEKLFTVMNAERLKVIVEIPSYESAKLSIGTVGDFKVSIADEKTLPVKVVALSPVMDPRTGTSTAELEFINDKNIKKDFSLPPIGAVGQVQFKLNRGKVIAIPENSMGYFEGKTTVKVIDKDNKAHRINIEVIEQRDSTLFIKAGLKEGDKLVLRANRSLKEGEEVEVEKDKAPETEKSIQ